MTSFLPLVTAGGDVPAWMPWTLDHVQAGVLVLDAELRVVFANQWLLRRARLGTGEISQRNLLDVFPDVQNSHLEKTLRQALRTGFSAVLSETLHLSPLPLFGLSGPRSDERRLKQSIQVVPMGGLATEQAGQRHVLVQVTDVTPAVARERLLKEQAERLHGMAHVDALTEIGNRRHFDTMLLREWRHAQRQQRPVSLVLFDIDHFKQYNDVYGHPRGDACLKTLAAVMARVAQRPRDAACRYGGEELAMLLPDTDMEGACQLADKVLHRVRELRLPHPSNPGGIVTMSAGVATGHAQPGLGADELLRHADHALYEAKAAGRDCLMVYAGGD